MKVRVVFTYGITYGSVSNQTYPTLNIYGSGALPLLAQGKTMATGSASAGQTLEFTLIPYGNSYAWDADSNVRESTSDYTIYTDGSIKYNGDYKALVGIRRLQSTQYTNTTNGRYLTISSNVTNVGYYQRLTFFITNSAGYHAIVQMGGTDGGNTANVANLVGNCVSSIAYVEVDGYMGFKIKVGPDWSTLTEVESITGNLRSISNPSQS